MLPDDKAHHRTISGSFLSVITTILMLSYAFYKLDSLVSRNEYKVLVADRIDWYELYATFGYDNGFAFAVGFTAWDDGVGITEDPTYGQIKIFIKSWGLNAPFEDTFHEIETRSCNLDDFKGSADFFTPSKESEQAITDYGHRLKCIKHPE